MKYSIIIPTYNHLEDCLKPCLESIIKYTELNDDIEIIVVANGCKDETKEFVKSFGNSFKLLWFDEPLGYTKATNEGIKIATGEYVIFLNNDTILLDQSKNQWLEILTEPFENENNVGVTGPIKQFSSPAERDFIVFFCACTKREIIEKVGLLDEIYSPGAGEDIQFCVEAENLGYKLIQVPCGISTKSGDGLVVGGFPIYHKGEATVFDIPNWKELFDRNSKILMNKYNRRWKLCNNYERAVIGRTENIPAREGSRYWWAKENVAGNRVLDLGCSTGYGVRFFSEIPNLDYLGVDLSADVIEYAKEQFGDIPGVKFEAADINEKLKDMGHWDSIVCLECIEHLKNGKEIAQKLKEHCDTLLLTIPYREPYGMWGIHHRLHGLQENDFPDFEYLYMNEFGQIKDTPWEGQLINLMLMKWSKLKKIERKKITVTATISTKDRYFTTLPLAISAIANQTRTPEKLIIFDDGEKRDLRKEPVYNYLFHLLNQKGIDWTVVYGKNIGQVANHQAAIEMCKTTYIWRIDDDEVPEPNVLESLIKIIESYSDRVGAVAGLVMDPTSKQSKTKMFITDKLTNKIETVTTDMNIQWFDLSNTSPIEVDHLYSSFLFKLEAAKHGYCLELSRVGHREETIFTHEMKRAGWQLIVDPTVKTWHFRNPEGGIRSNSKPEDWDRDESIFKGRMYSWGLIHKDTKLIVLNNGIGDHICFKMILPEIKEKFKDKKIVLAVCHPDIFKDEEGVKLISIANAISTFGSVDHLNVYAYMKKKNWKGNLVDAFRSFYLGNEK